MSLLMSVLFVLLVSVYVLFMHKDDYSFAPFVSGLIAGVCVLPISLLFKVESYTSPNFFAYSFSYFLFYHLLSSAFGLCLYFLFNVKSFDIKTTPCALSGIWTVFFFFAAYDFSRSPEVTIYVIFLFSYISSLLFYDVLVMSFSALPSLLLFLLSYPLALLFAYLSTFSFAIWLYKNSPLLYLGLPIFFIFAFLALAILLVCKKNSNKQKRSRSGKQSVKDIFEETYYKSYKETSL